jgi:hypothetical protein
MIKFYQLIMGTYFQNFEISQIWVEILIPNFRQNYKNHQSPCLDISYRNILYDLYDWLIDWWQKINLNKSNLKLKEIVGAFRFV